MKHDAATTYMVFDLEGVPLGELGFKDGFEVWPDGVNGWTHCLDCTVEPYAERTLEDNLHFAEHVHKRAVVMKL